MKLRLFLLTMVTATLAACQHEPYTLRGNSVEIRLAEPEAGGPQMLRLTAISDKVIHVTATPDRKWHDKESLIVSPSPALSGTEKAESIRLDVKSEPANDSLQISTSAGCASARPTTKPSTASDSIRPTSGTGKAGTRSCSSTIRRSACHSWSAPSPAA